MVTQSRRCGVRGSVGSGGNYGRHDRSLARLLLLLLSYSIGTRLEMVIPARLGVLELAGVPIVASVVLGRVVATHCRALFSRAVIHSATRGGSATLGDLKDDRS